MAQIEVVANASGINLLKVGHPLNDKVMSMMDEYDNLTFIACANAIKQLRAQGIHPAMLKKVGTEKTAFSHIVARLQNGWRYVKVDADMMKI